ncbi:MAG: DNA replication/repair protein RecF [Halioglobus sp.]|nr:DNA replication/repair protein RecF [Halioglobus sp.]
MALSELQIAGVRNLRQVRLLNLPRVNVIFGDNGSGKTSLLEAIHVLGMARSFRGNTIRTLITHGQTDLTVFGALAGSGSTLPLGVKRSLSGDMQIKVGGRVLAAVAELAAYLPLQTITADSFSLLEGAPVARRQYLDWGVFHVEHRFIDEWRRFQRCIKQRNMLLRRGNINEHELRVWTRDLAVTGEAISRYREAYFDLLVPRFESVLAELAPALGAVKLQYRRGWDRQLSYEDALENGRRADIEQGYTHCGPQRADVRVSYDGYQASDTLSRGQQKLVVCSLKLAQGQLMSEQGRRQCTYLIDDLPAELDREHNRLICAQLARMDAQVFITCVDPQDIMAVWPHDAPAGVAEAQGRRAVHSVQLLSGRDRPEAATNTELAMFHVEHGSVARHE